MKCEDRQHFIHISYSFPIAGNVIFCAVGDTMNLHKYFLILMICKTKVSLKFIFDFSTWPPLLASYISVKGGQVAKLKKIFRLNCVLHIINQVS